MFSSFTTRKLASYFFFDVVPLFAAAALPAWTTAGFGLTAFFFVVDRERRTGRTGLFQPTALSERNDFGIAIIPAGSSVTASAAASERSARTSPMTVAGRFARAA